MSVTLAELKTRVREKADMVNSQFVSDSELKTFINGSYAELYDLLVSRYEDYFLKSYAFTILIGNSNPLPSDFYKVRGVDLSSGLGTFSKVRKWSFEERNANNGVITRMGANSRAYRVMGGEIKIIPEAHAQGDYQLWYIPRVTQFVSDASSIDDVLDFDEYIVIDAAIKCLLKEESDVSVLLRQKEDMRQRVLAMASARDSEPDTIQDVRFSNQYGF